MKYLLPFLLLIAKPAFGQEQKIYDFSGIDPRVTTVEKIDSLTSAIYRANYYKLHLDSLAQLRAYLFEKNFSPKYVGLFVGYTSSKASLSYLNSGLRALGMPELSENFGFVPFGIDVRGKRLLFSYVFSPGIYNSVSNDTYTVEARGFQLEFLFGYDVLSFLHAERFHFYPFAAVSLQSFEMNSFRNAASTDIITVNDIIQNPSGTRIHQNLGVITYGAELDIRLTDPSRSGLIIGFRYGITKAFAEGGFRIDSNSSSFSTPDRIQDQFISLVLKLVVRR